MNYIYNIKINLKSNLINFYEWEENDNIQTLNRVVPYLISTKDYINILNMNVKLSKETFSKLILQNNICLFTNLIDCVCVHFNSKRIIDKISKLSLLEEREVLEDINKKNKIKLEYKVINSNNNYKLLTRKEERIINLINKFIEKNKEREKIIDYLYYEWFKCNKSNNKYNELLKVINGKYSKKHEEIYNIIKLIEFKSA